MHVSGRRRRRFLTEKVLRPACVAGRAIQIVCGLMTEFVHLHRRRKLRSIEAALEPAVVPLSAHGLPRVLLSVEEELARIPPDQMNLEVVEEGRRGDGLYD